MDFPVGDGSNAAYVEHIDGLLNEAVNAADYLYGDEAGAYVAARLWSLAEEIWGRSRLARVPLTDELRSRILERDEFACATCGATDDLQIDHIVPVRKGGPNVEFNLQVLCAPCNQSKGAK